VVPGNALIVVKKEKRNKSEREKEKFDLWGSLHLGSSNSASKEKLPS